MTPSEETNRRLAAILAVDVVGYSRMMSEDEAGALAVIQRLRDETLEPPAQVRGGHVLKRMGDGWLFEFPSIRAAAETAVTVLEGTADDPVTSLRMGLHLGEVTDVDGETYGDGINIAARLEALSATGTLVLSEDARRQLSNSFGGTLHDGGQRTLKNIAEPMQVWSWPDALPAAEPTGGKSRIFIERVGDQGDSDALADELATTLDRQTGLQLMADPAKARFTLSCPVRRAGSRWRVTVHFFDTVTGTDLWRGRIEETGDDAFEVIDLLVLRIAGELRYKLQRHEAAEVRGKDLSTLSIEKLLNVASGLFQSANYFDWASAEEPLRRAVALDPDNFMALAMLVTCTSISLSIGWRAPDQETIDETMALADKAVSLAPHSDFAVFTRGVAEIVAGNIPAARRWDLRAAEINASYANVIFLLSIVEAMDGNPDKAAEYARETLKTDVQHPLRFMYETASGYAAFAAGDLAEAAAAFSRAWNLAPVSGVPALGLIAALHLSGDHAGATTAIQRLGTIFADFDPELAAVPPFVDEAKRLVFRTALIESWKARSG